MTLIAARSGLTSHDSVVDFVTLSALVATAGDYMTLESPVGTDYQVPVGKTLVITKVVSNFSGAPNTFNIGYGDTGVASGAAAPTNPVNLTGKYGGGQSSVDKEQNVHVKVPASKYPYIKSGAGSAGNFTVEGFTY